MSRWSDLWADATFLLIVALWLVVLVAGVARAALQDPPPRTPPPSVHRPCTAIVFRETLDSVYAELQAPRGTRRCVVEIK